MGFEPTTSGATIQRSTTELHPPCFTRHTLPAMFRPPCFTRHVFRALFPRYFRKRRPARLPGLARPRGFEPLTLGLAYQLLFSQPLHQSLWSGLSLHRLRCRTYSLYGAPWPAIMAGNRGFPRDCQRSGLLTGKVSPLRCGPLYRFYFPVKAPLV